VTAQTLDKAEAALAGGSLRLLRMRGVAALRPLGRRARRLDPLSALGVLALFAVWWLAAALIGNPTRVPAPDAVVARMVNSLGFDRELMAYRLAATGLAENAVFTAVNVFIGAAAGCLIGITVGLISARSWFVRAAVNPLLTAIGVVPVIIAMPFFFVWFGTGRVVACLFVAVYSSLIVAVYSQRAVDNLDPIYERAADVAGASRRSLLRDVLLPGTLPEVLGGIRIALAGAWGLEALAELIAVPQGLGQVIEAFNTQVDIQGMLAAVLLLCLLAVAVDKLWVAAIRRVTDWRDR
jgi:ABC-type nitrate/sulfonate/bicarbonate transport system permease component